MLHAPDFLGYAGAIEMARDHREIVEQGLQMKKAGNALMTRRRRPRGPPDQRARRRLLPRARRARELRALVEPLERAREIALATVRWAAELRLPRRRARRRARRAARAAAPTRSTAGAIVSDRGLDIAPAEFDEHFVEEHVEHSNALHARIRDARHAT